MLLKINLRYFHPDTLYLRFDMFPWSTWTSNLNINLFHFCSPFFQHFLSLVHLFYPIKYLCSTLFFSSFGLVEQQEEEIEMERGRI
jgi:hypothetical protein